MSGAGWTDDGADSTGSDVARIVSIGGSVTEIVYALGAEDGLVAVDSTSLYPQSAQDLPDVGYMRQLAAEPILALGPTLLLAVDDAGPPTVLDQLREAGTPLVVVPDEPSPEGVAEKVRVVANALGMEGEGATMAERLTADFAALRDWVATTKTKPKVLFLLSVGNGAPLAAGRETSAAGIIELAGGANAIDGFEGYEPLSPEATVTAAPDVVLVTGRTFDLLGGQEAILSRPEIAATPAGQNGDIVVMDGLLLLGFGPRTPEAARELALALHPDLQE
ncbi:MAG: ABC transporter substrate-binding protein [Pseudomonadota bacterium]